MIKIFIASDHAGYELKDKIKNYLENLGYEIEDKGAFAFNKDDDYPDFVKSVAMAISLEPNSFGIIIGGSGEGEAICANRFKNVRAVVYYGKSKTQKDIDGKIFKNLSHGMNSSLRGLFDRVVKKDKKRDLSKHTEENDFSLNSEYQFVCADKTYQFNFRNDYTLTVFIAT